MSLSQDIEKQEIRKLLTAVLTISIIVSGIAFGLTVMSSRRPVRFLQQLIIAIDRLSKGEIPDEITEKYKGEFNDIKQNLNRLIQTMHEMTEIARQVADGNLAVKVKERSANDWLMKALKAMVRRLTRFSNELDGLVQAVDAGDLSRRGNVAIFSGGWRELVSGVNNVIDAFVEMTQHNERLKTENLRMSAELEVSQRIQQMVLPSPEELQQMAGVEIVGYMQPADEVGGDYYDVLNTNGTLHIGIGDVTGHGLESGVLMLMTQAAIRTLVEYGETDPVLFFTVLNRVLKKNIERMQADKTLTLAVVNYDHGTLRIVGQHEELLVIRQGGRVERVDTVDLGFPLGLTDEIADFVAEARVVLQSGDSVVLYTDGIPEAENIDGHQYGLDRLCGVLSQHWADPAEAIKQAVIDDVARHIGAHKIYDDVTLLVMKQQ